MGFSWSTTVLMTKLFTRPDGFCLTRMILPGWSRVLRSRSSLRKRSGRKRDKCRTWCSSQQWYAMGTGGSSTTAAPTSILAWPSHRHVDYLQMNVLGIECNSLGKKSGRLLKGKHDPLNHTKNLLNCTKCMPLTRVTSCNFVDRFTAFCCLRLFPQPAGRRSAV